MARAMGSGTHFAGRQSHRPGWLSWCLRLPRWLRPTVARSLLAAAILTYPLPAAALPPAKDLAADARQMREKRLPLLLFYSRGGCVWCERARREYLEPLAADPANAGRLLIRQVDIDRQGALIDFAGKPGSHRDFARRRNVRLAPTIQFVGPAGESLAEPIVGMPLPDFYGIYIERAVDAARARLQETTP